MLHLIGYYLKQLYDKFKFVLYLFFTYIKTLKKHALFKFF